MEKKKPKIGMKVKSNNKGKIGTIIKLNKTYALVALDIGYKENFYYTDLKYIKE